MFFSKKVIATAALFLGFALQAQAHAGVTPALGVSGSFVRKNVQRPSAAKPCGKIDIAGNIDTSTPISVGANGSFTATITNFNLGVDGSREVTAQVDPTGTGSNFQPATVVQNGDRRSKSFSSQQLVVQLPAGMTCSGGASQSKCLVSFKSVSGFGNCVVVQNAGGNDAAGAAGTAAAAGDDTDGTASAAGDDAADTTAAAGTGAADSTATAGNGAAATATATEAQAASKTQAQVKQTRNVKAVIGCPLDLSSVISKTGLPALNGTSTYRGGLDENRDRSSHMPRAANCASGDSLARLTYLPGPALTNNFSMASTEWPGIPQDVRSRTLPIRDLDMHFFEAGNCNDPLIVLLHGFPELAYSWRKVIAPLARQGQGYYVVAPDLRGFGRTKPKDSSAPGRARPVAFEDDVRPYQTVNLVHDVVALVFALGHKTAACVMGHDAGSTVAGYCAIIRPELFQSVVFMSTPFTGPPDLPFDVAAAGGPGPPTAIFPATLVEGALATLSPPRKHYMLYYSTPKANDDMWHPPQGLHAFFRGYYHLKSADSVGDVEPHPIRPSAVGIGSLPHYYVMPRDATMAQIAHTGSPPPKEVEAKSARWLPDEELAVYAREYGRTGFQGGLNRYRAVTDPALADELRLFAGRKIEVATMYVSGRMDWGVYQNPGAIDKMQNETCTDMGDRGFRLISDAGHWIQQEQPEKLMGELSRFLTRGS
ncbi:Alpha/Beta hydrolase protein [Trametes meyenii]|nr:Alpha/Beta hydrolase protein [Trametes meyenii]